ncbi:MAG: hypothetical protein NTU60_07320 [Candidatus Aminicenantes bacterium]|nr:hypothetical protein [Candidatus Aminicenantes bacterium]
MKKSKFTEEQIAFALRQALKDKSVSPDLDVLKSLYRDKESSIINTGTYACVVMVLKDEPKLHISPGRPYHGSHQLLVLGAADTILETPTGPIPIQKGKAYPAAESVPPRSGGYVLKVTNVLQFYVKILLTNPEVIDFPEFRSFSADVLLSSESKSKNCGAGLDYHTTIPEQPPGKSWWAENIIVKGTSGEAFLIGHYTNINTGSSASLRLGPAELDKWYNLRLDILTQRDAVSLAEHEIRIDYYVDGEFKDSLFPEDSAILLDFQRTGLGPHRSLIVYSEQGSANSVGYFDNVRAVYKDRINPGSAHR